MASSEYTPDINSFKPNSHAYKKEQEEQEKEEKRKVEKVIKGNVITRDQSVGKKILKLLFENDIKDVKDYLIYDLVLPRFKDTVLDIFTVLWKGDMKSSSKSGPYVSYSSKYKISSNKSEKKVQAKSDSRSFREIIFETRGDAEAVRNDLFDLIADYGCASIGDLYDMIGETGSFTDQKYGWYDISDSSIKRALGGGYLLELPAATLLD